ncbi:hypothetical protein PSHT_08342 [Puccinia striiformis]|uniref:Uncharacterized protein n=1 Tax=Puccinia striiformis TaxID=27350 RepID=A0A2S4VQP5_9BASI|nr:hypothetical protein PSHT_08342 [Puccinia striiformis]
MSDSGMSSSSEIASEETESVLEALEDLKERYMDPMFSRPEGPEKKEFTEDELDQKNRLFDQVQSTLVPLIQEQVDCVLSSLELQGDLKEEQKEPNFD